MSIKDTVLTNLINGTPPPKKWLESPGYRKGMKFNSERFAELCEQKGYDPAEVALEILKMRATELKAKEHLDAVLKLMEFAYPKQRAIEHSGSVGLTLPELLEQVDAEYRSRKAT